MSVRDIVRLRLQGVHVALNSVRLSGDCQLQAGVRIAHHAELLSTDVERYTSIGRYTKCHFAKIGPFCSIAWDATIGATGHPLDRVSTHAFPYRSAIGGFVSEDSEVDRPVTQLGADVWVGTHAVVMPGVRVGPGAVIGAGAIVTRDVSPYSVVAGAPAQVIRRRAPDEMIERLLDLQWWSWPDRVIRQHASLFAQRLEETVLSELEAIGHQSR